MDAVSAALSRSRSADPDTTISMATSGKIEDAHMASGGAAGETRLAGSVSSLPIPASFMVGQTGPVLTVSSGLDNNNPCANDQDMPGQGTSFYFNCTFIDSFNKNLDAHMDSPPPSRFELQGASRTTGGIFRGRAHGNNLNQADFAKEEDSSIPIVGKVYLYITSQDPSQWILEKMNRQVIKHAVTNSLVGVLEEIGDRHSPVRRKY